MRKQRYHRTDAWRGYVIPAGAIVGASDTGMWDDSPAPTNSVREELAEFGKYLHSQGIKWRTKVTQSSNVFMVKRWITVSEADFGRAAQLAVDWLDSREPELAYLHSADLDELGFKPNDASQAGAPTSTLPEDFFGTEGQDRESYSDTQDRSNYTTA